MEPLFEQFGVDMYLSGHMHMAEFVKPVNMSGVVTSEPVDYRGLENVYVRPKNTVRVVQATGGIFMFSDTYKTPAQKWSAMRNDKFGYGRLTFHNATLAQYEYVLTEHDNAVHDSFFIAK
eukprot:TRINITY_DN3091_c0_g1_i1.p2 TRINITY_DN3091_c0_g1~~TRINITY_DN3091_c0_g1_i1.p2  ORF type:complete len:120 (+),score=36.30 TRINITY_DN3091_c0_g1_i1:226-585(+)